MDRAKLSVTSPANMGEDMVSAKEKSEHNNRKHFHRHGARAKGRSGKGKVHESKRAHSRRA